MPIYNVAAIVVDLVEADSPEDAQRKLENHLMSKIDGDVSGPDQWSHLPMEAFESELLEPSTKVIV